MGLPAAEGPRLGVDRVARGEHQQALLTGVGVNTAKAIATDRRTQHVDESVMGRATDAATRCIIAVHEVERSVSHVPLACMERCVVVYCNVVQLTTWGSVEHMKRLREGIRSLFTEHTKMLYADTIRSSP